MITIDINKAKEISHSKRREAREYEFKVWDIQATIPSQAQEAEVKRQAIRDKYAVIQTQIDVATTAEDLKAIIDGM